MEPPAKPRKPRRIKDSQTPANDQETQETADSHENDAPEKSPIESSEAAKPEAKPKPRSRKPSPPVEPLDSDLTPVMSAPPLAILMRGLPPEKAPETITPESIPDFESIEIPPAVPVTRATAIEKPAQAPAKNTLIGVLRILSVRNIEIIRRYSGRAGQSSRQFAQRVSSVSIGGKPLGTVIRETGGRLRTGPGNLLTRLQRQLEASDAAVIAFTLFLIAACILLTLFGVYLWNRF